MWDRSARQLLAGRDKSEAIMQLHNQGVGASEIAHRLEVWVPVFGVVHIGGRGERSRG